MWCQAADAPCPSRANEPLNMSAVMRRADGSVVDGNPVLLAAAAQRFGSELLGVVEMQAAHETMRPVCLDLPLAQAPDLRQHGMRETQRHAGRRGRLQGQMEAHHTAGTNVDSECHPRPLDRCAGDAVHDDHVDQGVVDLDERKRPVDLQGSRDRPEAIPRRLAAFAPSRHLVPRLRSHSGGDRLTARGLETDFPTALAKLDLYVGDPRPLPREIDRLNDLIDQRLDLRRALRDAALTAWRLRQKTR